MRPYLQNSSAAKFVTFTVTSFPAGSETRGRGQTPFFETSIFASPLSHAITADEKWTVTRKGTLEKLPAATLHEWGLHPRHVKLLRDESVSFSQRLSVSPSPLCEIAKGPQSCVD